MKFTKTFLFLLCSLPFFLGAQNIITGEYFFDTDPGIGNGTSLSSFSAGEEIDIPTENIDISGLTAGNHTISVRYQYDDGRWSLAESRPFVVVQPHEVNGITDPVITSGEYFFDTDPGIGNGTPLSSFASGEDLTNDLENIDISGLSAGYHMIGVRYRYDDGRWSLANVRPFTIVGTSTLATQVLSVEYYFDDDPGHGLATADVTVTPGDSVILISESIAIGDLSPGTHTIGFRGVDDEGGWSFTREAEFEVIGCQIIERQQLIDLYIATDGDNWSPIQWDTTTNVNTWAGVALNNESCVTDLSLPNNNLVGNLNELDLSSLTKLDLQGNELSGDLPNFSLLPAMTELYLNNNNFSGSIPDFPGTDQLATLHLSFNELEGALPDFINLPGLKELLVDHNLLDGTIPDYQDNLPNLKDFDFNNNKITFEHFVDGITNNEGVVNTNAVESDDNVTYTPQDSIGIMENVSYATGDNHTIELGIDASISTNNYQWFRDGTALTPMIVNQLVLNNLQPADAGVYRAEVTNPAAAALTLHSRATTICVSSLNQLDETLCDGESRTINGVIYDANNPTGMETLAGANFKSCDSLINVNLSFHPPAINDLQQELCIGGSIEVNGNIYNEANPMGTEILASGSFTGCDSTVNIMLTFSDTAIEDIIETLCPGENIIANGNTYDQMNPIGTENLPGGSFLGCDSLINIDLTFAEPSIFDLNQEVCEGVNITVNGTIYDVNNAMGTEIIPAGSALGCDSTINVALTFTSDAIEGDLMETICASASLMVNGTVYDQVNPNGMEFLEGGSFQGCDSLINISLSFYEPAVNDLNSQLCTGTAFTINGTVYNEANPSGTEILSGQNYLGCDSTININLMFGDAIVNDLIQELCSGQSLTVNGTIYDENNLTGSETLENASFLGCDSIVNITLTYSNGAVNDLNQELCSGQSITINGTVYDAGNTSGTETIVSGASNGCDSIVNVSISFSPSIMGTLEATICPGESYSFGGEEYAEAGSYDDFFPGGSFSGCDSTSVLNLSVLEGSNFGFADAGVDISQCSDQVELSANQPANTTGIWTGPNAVIIDDISSAVTTSSNLSNGSNQFIWTLSNDECMDFDSDTVFITVDAGLSINLENDRVNLQFATPLGSLNVLENDDLDPNINYEIQLLESPLFGTSNYENGLLEFTPEGTPFIGDARFLYEVCISGCENNCATADVLFHFKSLQESSQPDATIITPNGDNINDEFIIDNLEDYPNNEIFFFNRWGGIVAQSKPYNNDWGGKNKNGKILPEGTYYYLAKLDISDGVYQFGAIAIKRK